MRKAGRREQAGRALEKTKDEMALIDGKRISNPGAPGLAI